jgi:hypothetical protein
MYTEEVGTVVKSRIGRVRPGCVCFTLDDLFDKKGYPFLLLLS